jgi:hypothetical protein
VAVLALPNQYRFGRDPLIGIPHCTVITAAILALLALIIDELKPAQEANHGRQRLRPHSCRAPNLKINRD